MKTKTISRPRRKRTVTATTKRGAPHSNGAKHWSLRLYLAGQTPRSLTAFANLKRLCDEYLAGRYDIEIIDLAKHPHLAQNDQIVALPTLVRKLPEPIKRLIGDLSNRERVMIALDLQTTEKN